MAGEISLAWAVAVDETQLIARVNAYVKARASITTLELCLKYSSFRKVREGLPAEIKGMVADFLKQEEYKEMYPHWRVMRRCTSDQCKSNEHFTVNEIMDLLDAGLDSKVFPGDLYRESCPKHYSWAEQYLQTVRFTNSKGNASMLTKGKEASCLSSCLNVDGHQLTAMIYILLQEFKICPYFTILERHEAGGFPQLNHDWAASVSAYLAMPITQAAVQSRPAQERASYIVKKILSPRRLIKKASKDVGPKFQKVINTLKLNAPHTPVLVRRHQSEQQLYDQWKEQRQDRLSRADSDDLFPSAETQSSVREDYDLKCLECDDTECHRDKQQEMKPKLMLLGSGEMVAI